MIKIKRGLDLPITGDPEQRVHDGPRIRNVAVVGFDYIGLKPTMAVSEGDQVQKGQLLFSDKKTEGVRFTAPSAGRVVAINRGPKRVFQSLVIEVDDSLGELEFTSFPADSIAGLAREQVTENLVQSGLWTAFRSRPFSKVPTPASAPHSIFVTAMDTQPLAADPDVALAGTENEFASGLAALARLTDGRVFVCRRPGSSLGSNGGGQVVVEEFGGPHPAGLAGTHIHFLDAASIGKTVWSLDCQDVVAIGRLFLTGKLDTDRVISLAGPRVESPRLVRTRMGASTDELTAGQLTPGDNRVISGSVLGGRTARGPVAWLGRYHRQVTVIAEGHEREFMGWLSIGANRFSAKPIYLSRLMPGKKFAFNTNTNGSPRAIVPVGSYEKVMPLDILPTHLLRSLVVGDIDMAEKLGALELDEEDLALCTFVCPGKYEYGPILRDNLTRIEQEQ